MKIEYNIKSNGTEKESNCNGYIAVTEEVKNKRYILPIPHDITEIEYLPKGYLEIDEKCDICTIAVARFALISKLMLKTCKISHTKKILVFGCGCVGYALLVMLKLMNYKLVVYTSLHKGKFSEYSWKDLNDINIENYDVIIDTTGQNEVLERAVNECKFFTKIILLGTPRNNPKVNLLQIHRKNLILCGAHELFGISLKARGKCFKNVLKMLIDSKLDFSNVCEKVKKFSDSKKNIYQIRSLKCSNLE